MPMHVDIDVGLDIFMCQIVGTTVLMSKEVDRAAIDVIEMLNF